MTVACTLAALPLFAQAGPSLSYEVAGREARDGVEVLQISFKAADSPSPTNAFLVRPESGGRGSAILYLHLLGPGGDKSEFLDEAKAMAAKGAVSLLPQQRVPWQQPWAGDAGDLELGRGQLAELRAGIAILRAERGVAKGRVAIVGHDYGAMSGLVLMAEDPAIMGGAFLAFAPRYSDWIGYFHGRNPLPKDQYDRAMAPLDPMKSLSRIGGRPLFLQFAKNDKYLSPDTIESIRIAAGPGPAFDVADAAGTNHENLSAKGAPPRLAWLDRLLSTP